MEHENGAPNTPLHTLIPLEDFKAILGIDDREDTLSRYCLLTATYTIEQYCKRRFYRKKYTDYLTFIEEHIFSLREYPVRKVLSVHAATAGTVRQGEALFGPENLIDPKHYYCIPDEGIHEDILFSLVLRPPIRFSREETGIKVRYLAGYSTGKAPADLASACLELAAWNMNRYRGPPPRTGERVLYRDDRGCPGERVRHQRWRGRGTSGSFHAGECTASVGTIPETDNMTDKGLFIEEIIINSLKSLLAGRVNELLEETEYPIPPVEFGSYRGGSAIVPVIALSICERSEKERIVRLDAYTLTITFTVPEWPGGERVKVGFADGIEAVTVMVAGE